MGIYIFGGHNLRFTDACGAPVGNAFVSLNGAASGSGTTDTSGHVIILINAAFGTVTATASKTGYSSGTITLSTGQEVPPGTVTQTPSPIVTVTPTSSGAVTRTMPGSVSPESL